MNVILLERFGNLGDLGEEVSVKAGFARNFLIPQGKAVRATQENRAVFEERRIELEKSATDLLTVAQGRARSLQDLTITIVVKAGEEGKLYGSVGPREIAEYLTSKGYPVEKSEVVMSEGAIRHIGHSDVVLQLHADVMSTMHVVVSPEDGPAPIIEELFEDDTQTDAEDAAIEPAQEAVETETEVADIAPVVEPVAEDEEASEGVTEESDKES